MAAEAQSLSTSALAKALKKTSKQMFSELEALGWIERVDDAWKLTAKGEFEGGTYRESKRFGRYIIWPESIVEHKALISSESQLYSVNQLAREIDQPAFLLSALLHNLGWLKRGRKGWRVTAAGTGLGGCQRLDAHGIPYVVWPRDLLEHTCFNESLEMLDAEPVDNHYPCIDGHKTQCRAEQQIDNWLYLSGLVHAYRHPLPFSEELYADFYLPDAQLYLEYWGKGNPAGSVTDKMRKKTFFSENGCQLIELKDEDIEHLYERLPQLLLNFDVEI